MLPAVMSEHRCDNIRRALGDAAADDVLVRIGHFERIELAVEQGSGHEVIAPHAHSLQDGLLVADEMNKDKVRIAASEDVAIAPLERRARDDQSVTVARRCGNTRCDGREPIAPVGVAERSTLGHSPNVFRRMHAVALQQGRGEPFGKQTRDRRLSRSRDTHDHES
jgi:hypothetical protein